MVRSGSKSIAGFTTRALIQKTTGKGSAGYRPPFRKTLEINQESQPPGLAFLLWGRGLYSRAPGLPSDRTCKSTSARPAWVMPSLLAAP